MLAAKNWRLVVMATLTLPAFCGTIFLATYAARMPTDATAETSLTIEVIDADSGTPLPARVYLRGEDGEWHFPLSASADGSAVPYRKSAFVDAGIVEMHTTVSAQPFVARLGPSRYTLSIERGNEYHPETREVAIGAEPVELTIRLKRWIDMAERGWYSGDTHVHRGVDELPNLMLAEDLNVAFPLTDWVKEAFVSPIARRAADFRDNGHEVIRIDDTHMIVPRNTEFEIFEVEGKDHTLGAFFVIDHKTPFDIGVPPVGPVARRAHQEGALIELDKHNWPWSMALVPVMPVDLFELANNHVWRAGFGYRDYGEQPAEYMKIERDQHGWTERGWIDYGFQNYYALLNCGFRLRPTAGTASGVHPVPLGFGRVYVRLEGPLEARAWLRGLNAGRSFVTTGPMLFVTLEGRDPGHRFTPEAPEAKQYRLAGTVIGEQPLSRIEIIVSGDVARALDPANRPTDRGAFESPIDEILTIDGSSWVAVRCFENRAEGRVRFAHTAPFHIDVSGRPLRPRKEQVDYLIERVETQIARSSGFIPEQAAEEYREALRAYRALRASAR
jgi:hypothetical protein